MTVIELTKDEKGLVSGSKMNEVVYFNPVLSSMGKWCLSIESVAAITNPDFLYLKDRVVTGYTSINDAANLSDVFNGDNIYPDDIRIIIKTLSAANSLVRKDIRFRGVRFNESVVLKERVDLFNQGVILLYSK